LFNASLSDDLNKDNTKHELTFPSHTVIEKKKDTYSLASKRACWAGNLAQDSRHGALKEFIRKKDSSSEIEALKYQIHSIT
jgi:hypothetical protein